MDIARVQEPIAVVVKAFPTLVPSVLSFLVTLSLIQLIAFRSLVLQD